jgi:hypothetical protein
MPNSNARRTPSVARSHGTTSRNASNPQPPTNAPVVVYSQRYHAPASNPPGRSSEARPTSKRQLSDGWATSSW